MSDTTELRYAADVLMTRDGRFEVVFLVPAWHHGPSQLVLWCPLCGALHFHGSVEDESKGIHRVAHCAMRERGNYWLQPMAGSQPRTRPATLRTVARSARAKRDRLRSGGRAR